MSHHYEVLIEHYYNATRMTVQHACMQINDKIMSQVLMNSISNLFNRNIYFSFHMLEEVNRGLEMALMTHLCLFPEKNLFFIITGLGASTTV